MSSVSSPSPLLTLRASGAVRRADRAIIITSASGLIIGLGAAASALLVAAFIPRFRDWTPPPDDADIPDIDDE